QAVVPDTGTSGSVVATLALQITLAGSGTPVAVLPHDSGPAVVGDVYDYSDLALLSGSGQGTTTKLLPGTTLGTTEPQSATWAADAYFATASGLTPALENPLEHGTPDEEASP